MKIIPFLQRSLGIICTLKIKILGFLKYSFSPRKITTFQLCVLWEKNFISIINVFWYTVSYLHFYDLIKSSESLRWDYFDREIGEWSRKEKRKAKSLRFKIRRLLSSWMKCVCMCVTAEFPIVRFRLKSLPSINKEMFHD